jgi:hypothetical protein
LIHIFADEGHTYITAEKNCGNIPKEDILSAEDLSQKGDISSVDIF